MPAPIPATLLCGFLGSGKTTRINRLIGDSECVDALFLVNDFGRINIDAALIESEDDHILRLTNGCACCGIAGNVSAQLRAIRDWPQPPARLVFEASGIARPRPLMQLLDAARGYRLAGAETLVDASAFMRHYRDPAIADIVVAQIQEVSHLRINRAGWLDDGDRTEVMHTLAALNPDAAMIVEPDDEMPAPEATPAAPAARGHGALVTESVPFDHPVDMAAVDALLRASASALVRAKGIVQADDAPHACYIVQLAGDRLRFTATRARRSQALVLIGYRGAALDTLIQSLRAL